MRQLLAVSQKSWTIKTSQRQR
ncbi:unnamed protein product [Linum tenue]|uniref:Uncharacterized protein n=1 Tax=Linum tenue TaxID=586396 RepID=A0AAV0MZ89_9ROSI|nr:unnamed protein product [Linum tenue]